MLDVIFTGRNFFRLNFFHDIVLSFCSLQVILILSLEIVDVCLRDRSFL